MAKPSFTDHEDLPIMSAKNFMIDRGTPDRVSLNSYRIRCVMETDDFVEFFNDSYDLKGKNQLTRRTLLFYASPQLQLLPKPVYRKRHTGYYIFPDHFRRLAVIFTLQKRFFFSLRSIKILLQGIPEESYDLIERWWGSGEALLRMIPAIRAGFIQEDIDNYQACVGLYRGEPAYDPKEIDASEEFRKRVLESMSEGYDAARYWISTGRGEKFLSVLDAARSAGPILPPRSAKGARGRRSGG